MDLSIDDAIACATCRFGDEMYGRYDEMICGRFPPVWTGSEWERPVMARSDFCGEWETKVSGLARRARKESTQAGQEIDHPVDGVKQLKEEA